MSKCRYCKLCGWANDGDKDFFGWCELRLDSYDIDEPRDCPDYIRASNADRIRAMSDEELAIWLAEWSFCADACPASTNEVEEAIGYCCPSNCKEQALTWLQQPAEEETIT